MLTVQRTNHEGPRSRGNSYLPPTVITWAIIADEVLVSHSHPAHAAGWMELTDYFPLLLWNHGLGEKSAVPEDGRQITVKVPDLPDII